MMGWLDASLKAFRSKPAEKSTTELMSDALDAAAGNDYESALAIWGPLAQQGVARAQNNVGVCFSEGMGVARDARAGSHDG